MDSRRAWGNRAWGNPAWGIFSIAVSAYLVAVLQRSSLGAAAVQASDRFGIAAAALSALAVVQLVVYAALQVPVGVMLDRIGPQRLLVVGATVMAVGQAILAVSPTFGFALVGRMAVGAGDAMTFISAARLLAAWFAGARLPVVLQLLGTIGQLGQVLSAFPLAIALHAAGWTPTYLSAAALSALMAVVLAAAASNSPPGLVLARPSTRWADSWHTLMDSLRRPGTQLGFWSHFVTQSSVTMFGLLWGFPFLSIGLGYGPTGAAALLALIIVAGAIGGPVIGILTARYPFRRSSLVLGIVAAMAVAWALVLLWPGEPPLPVVIVLIVAIAVGGPGSLIGFDFARTFNPAGSLGSASGIVNVGGFSASFVMMFLIGLVLDALDRAQGGSGEPTALFSLDSFRVAFAVQYPIVGGGVVFLLLARRRARRRLLAEEGIEVAPLWVAVSRRWAAGRRRSTEG